MTESYRIVSFYAENVKRLKVVKIEPGSDPLVQITGRNGQGKTSVLDSIYWALTGTEHIQDEPIRKGADEAKIELDLGGVVVRRVFRRKGDKSPSELQIENADGARFPKPQTMLNALLDTVSLDPLAFMRKDNKGRFDALRSFVPGIDFDELAAKRKGLFDRRTDVNRRAKQEAAAAELIKVDSELQLVPEGPILNELTQALEQNATVTARRERRELAQAEIASSRERAEERLKLYDRELAALQLRAQAAVKEIDDEIARLQQKRVTVVNSFRDEETLLQTRYTHDVSAISARKAELEQKLAEAGELPAEIDVAAIRARLDAAQVNNRNASAAEQKRKHAAAAKEAEQESANLTLQIEELDAGKAAAIAAAKLPVEGLDFGDGTVLFNGVPLDQASDAEQLRVSVALAMAGNPKLRIIRVRDGSLLDDDAMKLLAEMAREKDYQVWIERVDSSGKIGFVLEDGSVVHRPADEEGRLL